jgi:hypothetical protein
MNSRGNRTLGYDRFGCCCTGIYNNNSIYNGVRIGAYPVYNQGYRPSRRQGVWTGATWTGWVR